MKRFVEGESRQQMILLPDCLDDYVVEDNPVRVIDVFIDELDLAALCFEGMLPATMGRPAYHPATLLKIYLYGYLNKRRLTMRGRGGISRAPKGAAKRLSGSLSFGTCRKSLTRRRSN